MSLEINPEIKPLTIRGHHLEQFFYLLVDYYKKPEKFAIRLANAIKHQIEENPKFPNYDIDVLGKTPEEMQLFTDNITKLAIMFLTFPDDYPIQIVFGESDDICQACIIGKHCRKVSAKYDRQAVDSFMPIKDEYTLGSLKAHMRSHFRISTPQAD